MSDATDEGDHVLLEALARRPVSRLIVASSMSLYGEGMYRTPDGELVAGTARALDQLRRADWELRDARGRTLVPVPTPEDKPPALASVYALSKFDQEQLCLMVGAAYGIPTTALRFFNVFGTRQALSNPYTGVLAIFAPDAEWLLPGLWQILVGLGIFASFRSLPRGVALAGGWYVAAGLAALALASETRTLSPWAMGAPFAIGQFLLAVIMHFAASDDDGQA